MDGTGNIMSAITCAVGYYDKGTTYTTTPDHVCTACPTNSASCTSTKVVCKSGYTPIGGTGIGGVTTEILLLIFHVLQLHLSVLIQILQLMH